MSGCDLSGAIDIATGHFEIGAFLALDGAWQKVDRIRLLIGGETSRTTADAIAAALDTSIKVERQAGDAFLTGVEGVVDGIRSGKIEIRVYKPRSSMRERTSPAAVASRRLGSTCRLIQLYAPRARTERPSLTCASRAPKSSSCRSGMRTTGRRPPS